MSTEPGWYPDENDAELARFWDGSAWTDRTRPSAEVTGSVLDRRVSMRSVVVGVAAAVGVVAAVAVILLVLGGDDGDSTAAPPSTTGATVAPATTAVTEPIGGDPMTVERLLNIELPDLTAEGGFPGGQLVDGRVALAEFGESLSTSEADMFLGDFTGDGVDDGLVAVTDEFEGGNNFAPKDLYLFDAGGDFLGALHNAEIGGSAEFPAVDGDTLTFEVLSLGPDDPRCCPSVQTIVRFRWTGTDFEPV